MHTPTQVKVKVWFNVPNGITREVFRDRLMLVERGYLSLRDADFIVEAWDDSDVPASSER